jgi:hypothetical protein
MVTPYSATNALSGDNAACDHHQADRLPITLNELPLLERDCAHDCALQQH